MANPIKCSKNAMLAGVGATRKHLMCLHFDKLEYFGDNATLYKVL
jgi:hypothetical protein